MSSGRRTSRKAVDWSTSGQRLPEGYTRPAVKQTIDGRVFDSTLEADRYCELKLLAKAGEIRDLKCQVPFDLSVGDTWITKYIADFTYTEKNGQYVVEDTKGVANKLYLVKRRLMIAIHNIAIRETYRDQVSSRR